MTIETVRAGRYEVDVEVDPADTVAGRSRARVTRARTRKGEVLTAMELAERVEADEITEVCLAAIRQVEERRASEKQRSEQLFERWDGVLRRLAE